MELTIRASDATTEVYLIDSGRRLVSRGIGSVDGRVPPGIYTVKARKGDATHERLVVIRPEDDQRVERIPELEIRSAAPLHGTKHATRHHVSSAMILSESIDVNAGSGSELLICARTVAGAQAKLTFKQLAILDADGSTRLDVLSAGGDRLRKDVTFTGCNAALHPGPYRVAYRIAGGPHLEQSIVTAAGWQTQMFLLETSATNRTQLSIPEISILMGRNGFQPAAENARWCEVARHALTARRPKLAEQLATARRNRISDPMVGIYVLHLLVLAKAERAQIAPVLRRVRELVRAHPDVEIVAQHFGRPAHTAFEAPPMFRQSWEMLLAATVQDERLVPANSLSAEVAPRVIASTPWLIWTANRAHRRLQAELRAVVSAARTEPTRRTRSPRESAASEVDAGGGGIDVGVGGAADWTTHAVRPIARRRGAASPRTGPRTKPPPPAAAGGRRTTRPKTDDADQLVDVLQLPRSTIEKLLRNSARDRKRQ